MLMMYIENINVARDNANEINWLEKIGLLGCTPADTSMEANYKFDLKKDSPLVDTGRY